MLQKSLKKILESEAVKLSSNNKSKIVDIILFGSFVKGKESPKDMDILLVFKNKKNLELAHNFRKSLEKKINLQVGITCKVYNGLFERNFTAREAILTEGYSLINKIGFSEGLGYKNVILFIYKLKGKNNSERMRFYYSLYGRNSEGILKILNAKKYAETLILCPVENQEKMRNYLENWKIEFREIPLLIPSRLV